VEKSEKGEKGEKREESESTFTPTLLTMYTQRIAKGTVDNAPTGKGTRLLGAHPYRGQEGDDRTHGFPSLSDVQ